MVRSLTTILVLTVLFALGSNANAGTIDFTGIPNNDTNQFVQTDMGVTFTFTPTDNFVGGPRWINPGSSNGLFFGGGGGSSIEFTFTTDTNVTLDTYTIGNVFHLGNPQFDILDNTLSNISSGNNTNIDGTFVFNSGPLTINAGELYTVDITTIGAGVQSAFTSWEFTSTAVPEPSSLLLFGSGVVGFIVYVWCRKRADA